MDMLEAILLTIATASTPLLIAAIGELVVERSGVLNLGVEGMMVMGAVTGFGVALSTGSPWLGVLAADAGRRAVFAAVRLPDADAGDQPGGDRPGADAARARLFRHARRRLRRPARRAARQSVDTLPLRPAAGRQADLRPGSDLLPVDPADRRRRLVPVPHAGRADAALDRRQPRLGACARHQRDRHPLSRGDVRRRLRRARRRASVAGLHAAMGGEHDRRPRLDRAGAGGVRVVAAVARAGRRLSVRRHQHRPAAHPGHRPQRSRLPARAALLALPA